MKASQTITLIGVSVIFIYILVQLLTFYGIGSDSYGTYIAFYAFILLSVVILPNSITHL